MRIVGLPSLLSLSLACASNFALCGNAAAAEPAWQIRHVTVIPADTDEVLPDRSVLIRNGHIEAIVADDGRDSAKGVQVIDGRGKYLIPGLVDAHVHIANEGEIRGNADPVLSGLPLDDGHAYDLQILTTFLKAGVTAVANLGGSERSDDDLLWLRDEIVAGRLVGPTLIVGKRINGPHAEVSKDRHEVPASTQKRPTTAADGIAAVDAARTRGYDFIKPYQHLNRETYQAIVDEAHKVGFVTTGHLPELECDVCVDRDAAFAHSMDNIAHAEELGRYGLQSNLASADLESLAETVARQGMSVTPTLITQKTIVHMYVDRKVPSPPAGWLALVDPVTKRDWYGEGNRYLSQKFREQGGAELFPAIYDFSRVLTRELWKRGVPLTVGTDAPMPVLAFGVSVHQEMFELRQVGLPPIEVLRAASINAHRLFRNPHGTGAVRSGEVADLVLLEADPVSDIHNISRISGVFVRGRWMSMAEIDRLLNTSLRANVRLSERLK